MSFFDKLKKVAKGAVVGAVVGFTGGAGLGLLGVSTIAGATITATGGAIWGAVYGGLQGASMALIKPPKMDMGDVNAKLNLRVDAQALGTWVFGETNAATEIVYSERIDDNFIVQVICAAAHEIDSYGDLYVNDELIEWNLNVSAGEWDGVIAYFRNLGTQDQTSLFIPESAWPSTARGRGVAHYALKWRFDGDAGKEKLSGGLPSRITQVVRGCKVYDPRRDSTNGGSGPHRADDQSTWEWSSNWALITAHYLMGWRNNGVLIYGVGAPPSKIDWPSVIAMADVCDQVLDGKPRYRIGGSMQITNNHAEVIGALEACVGGKVSEFGGKYFLWVPHDDLESDIGTITDDVILREGGVRFTPSGPMETLYNTTRGRYVSPEALYQPVPYPEISEPTAVADDGRVRLMEQEFPLIQDVEIAQRVAREKLRRTRFSGTLTLALGPVGLLLRPFSVVPVNIQETNNETELFRVVAMQYSGTGAVIVELLEEDASIYDVSMPIGQALTQLTPNSYDPTRQIPIEGLGAESVSVIQTGGGAVDAIRVFWDTPGGHVEYTEVGYNVNAGGEFTYLQNSEVDQAYIVPALPDSIYEIRARHVSISGVPGPWEIVFITTGNADFDRISFIGIDDPINPDIFVTGDHGLPLASVRIRAGFEQSEFSALPDRLFVFYSFSDNPNQVRAAEDAGSRIYISTAEGDGVNSHFNLTVAPGSTTRVVRYTPGTVDPDLYALWWASPRNDPGPAAPYQKVVQSEDGALHFAPGNELPFVPSPGQLIDVAEVDWQDQRKGEFALAWINGEVVRHDGIKYDASTDRYYLDVVQRAAEGTTQANQQGQWIRYFPAPGPLTDILDINVGDFEWLGGSQYTYSGELTLNIPSVFGYAAVSCCLAREATVQGRQVFVRSNIVELTQVGPV